mgnify:CR=1 FL=1
MNLYEKIVNREEKISLVGLGYVGMPIAVAFAKKVCPRPDRGPACRPHRRRHCPG